MKLSDALKVIVLFNITFLSFPLITNALGGYTWEANLKDTFTVGRIATGLALSVFGYKFYLKKQKA